MRRFAFSLLAAALASAGAATAQPTGGRDGYDPQAYPQAGPRPGQSGYDQGYDDDDRAGPPAGGSAYGGAGQGAPDLARELGLSADQRAALQAYQSATTPTAAEQAQMQANERALAAMTTPQRLDAIAAQMRRDDADFARRADAVRRFYAQLTPAQQRRFDQITGPEAEPQGGPPNGYGGDDATGPAPPR